MRRAARADDSKREVVDTVRSVGGSVTDIGYPFDILVGFRGKDYLVDCKTDHVYVGKDGYAHRQKARVTKSQEAFLKNHKGTQLRFWKTKYDVLAGLGLPLVSTATCQVSGEGGT